MCLFTKTNIYMKENISVTVVSELDSEQLWWWYCTVSEHVAKSCDGDTALSEHIANSCDGDTALSEHVANSCDGDTALCQNI